MKKPIRLDPAEFGLTEVVISSSTTGAYQMGMPSKGWTYYLVELLNDESIGTSIEICRKVGFPGWWLMGRGCSVAQDTRGPHSTVGEAALAAERVLLAWHAARKLAGKSYPTVQF